MKNFLFIIAFLIVITSIVVGINPQMEKRVIIGSSDIVVDNKNVVKQGSDIKLSNKDTIIDKNETAIKSVDSIKKVDNVETKTVEADDKLEQLIKFQAQEDAKREAQEQKLAQQKALQAKKKAQEEAKLAQQKAQEEAKKKAEEQARLAQQKAQEDARKKAEEQARLAQQKAAEQAKLAKQKAEAEAKRKAEELAKKQAEEQKKLVQYQEKVLWNQWHANVNNGVANRLVNQFTNSAIPPGTVYTYSFDVNNRRQISNISVRISRGHINTTTQQGIFMVQQAISSMNLSTGLSFPSGSQRTSVNVVSSVERTSSLVKSLDASSFNDVEVITKQRYQ